MAKRVFMLSKDLEEKVNIGLHKYLGKEGKVDVLQ
jgi:hypothetical protein